MPSVVARLQVAHVSVFDGLLATTSFSRLVANDRHACSGHALTSLSPLCLPDIVAVASVVSVGIGAMPPPPGTVDGATVGTTVDLMFEQHGVGHNREMVFGTSRHKEEARHASVARRWRKRWKRRKRWTRRKRWRFRRKLRARRRFWASQHPRAEPQAQPTCCELPKSFLEIEARVHAGTLGLTFVGGVPRGGTTATEKVIASRHPHTARASISAF